MSFLRKLRAAVQSLLYCCVHRSHEKELDDETFYRLYYGHTTIPKYIPIRVRKVFVEQVGSKWKRVKPEDRPTDADDDLDFADICAEVENEFGITITEEEMGQLDGSFDSIVQYLAKRSQARLG